MKPNGCMMHKLAALFAAVLTTGCLAGFGHAAVVPLENGLAAPELPADLTGISLENGLPQLAIGTAQSLAPAVSHHTPQARAPELSLRPSPGLITYSDFTLGRTSLAKLRQRTSDLNWRMPASSNTAHEWAFIRREVIGAEGLDALGEMFDVNEEERPWSDTTTVHVLAPTGNWFVPFATVAHEVDSLDTYDRYGLGGGAQMTIGKNTTLGTELIYFGERLNDANVRETRVMAHLEIQF